MTKLRERELVCAEVLRENGESMRGVARQLGVDESTIRYRLRRRGEGEEDGRCRQPSLCDPYGAVIAAWIERQLGAERPDSVRSLYEELVREHGYSGSYKAVVRYLRRHGPRPKVRPKRRVETAPGAQAQVDWLTQRVWLHECGGAVAVDAFVMVLSYSRMWAVIWSLSKEMLSWIECHNAAFQFLHGVPKSVRIDNLKTGVASGAGAWAQLNAGYASYADQMGFCIDPCRVRKASDKGKVERRGRDVKQLLVSAHERFASLDALQKATDERILARAKQLICPVTGKSIHESWLVEQGDLSPLPVTLPTPFDVQVTREVSEDCVVSFEGRQYSVPFVCVGRAVEVRGCPGRVEIYRKGERIATYPRGTDCRLLIDQNHYEGEGTDGVIPPTPLGRMAKEIVLEKSWEAPSRSMDRYEAVVRSLSL